jgi:hypothetical protein
MMILLLFLQKQNLADVLFLQKQNLVTDIYLFGLGTLLSGPAGMEPVPLYLFHGNVRHSLSYRKIRGEDR